MPYLPVINIMAKNELTVNDPDLYELRFFMLWNSIISHHFPVDKCYGIDPQASIPGTGTKQFLVKTPTRFNERVAVVVELRKPAPGAREILKQELLKSIKERFDETVIYAIAVIGSSWAAYEMETTGSHELKPLTDWSSNVTSAQDYSSLHTVAQKVHEMTESDDQWKNER